MNCWQLALYSAYLAGDIDRSWLRSFYDDVSRMRHQESNTTKVRVATLLGWSLDLPVYPATYPMPG